MFSYVSAEERVPHDHPLRAIRACVDDILGEMTREFDVLYAQHGRPSIPPERLLRAQLLQLFYTIRSERLPMEQLDDNILFRWFVGLHARPRIERACAWLKTIAGLRTVKLRGLIAVNALFVFASAAFDIKRIVILRAAAA
jgi:transposase